MITRRIRIAVLMFLVLLPAVAGLAAEDTAKPADFCEVVVDKAISFMPSEQKTKLTAVKKAILAAMKPKAKEKDRAEATYFVKDKKGKGPEQLAEHFNKVRKGVGDKALYTTLSPDLGLLTACIIDLCQPYHTDETAMKSPSHAEFEKSLDSEASSLKASVDKLERQRDPAAYGVKIAGRANDLLKKLGTKKSEDAAAVRSEVFSLAANSVADCWYTLLVPDDSQPSVSAGYIGNKNSKKFHLPTCSHLPDEKNRVFFKTREEAIEKGFVPCKICKP